MKYPIVGRPLETTKSGSGNNLKKYKWTQKENYKVAEGFAIAFHRKKIRQKLQLSEPFAGSESNLD
jgi:hypothetical protein